MELWKLVFVFNGNTKVVGFTNYKNYLCPIETVKCTLASISQIGWVFICCLRFLSHLWDSTAWNKQFFSFFSQKYHECNFHHKQAQFILLFFLPASPFFFYMLTFLSGSIWLCFTLPLSISSTAAPMSLFLLNLSQFSPHIPKHGHHSLHHSHNSLWPDSEKALIVQPSL